MQMPRRGWWVKIPFRRYLERHGIIDSRETDTYSAGRGPSEERGDRRGIQLWCGLAGGVGRQQQDARSNPHQMHLGRTLTLTD